MRRRLVRLQIDRKEIDMKARALAGVFATAALAAGTAAHAAQSTGGMTMLNRADIQAVAPALDAYTQGVLLVDLWKRPGLGMRDRSLVTLAALIAKGQIIEMRFYINRALDSGVKPGELSETITHLAFYSGFPSAMAAVAVAKDVFAERKIGADQLPAVSPRLLPLDEESEANRATSVGQLFGATAPGVVQYTTDLLFRDLWLRPDLAPRDRSLVTISALIASGQVAQFGAHLGRAMDNGLTQAEAAETMTQLAFYVGWPNVFTAMPVARDVFEKRAR
jgi:4-carboxymuconolactone decarboxylase